MPRIAIVGAGPGGICAGIRLKQTGCEDFLIFEQAPGVGGTWWHNGYPGCACDVPSHLYSFSFATKADWPRPYADQPEIQAYMAECVDRFGLAPHIRLNTRVRSARWNEVDLRWTVVLESGEQVAAEVLIGAVGLFNEPSYPPIAGLDRFAGTMFHSARWRHDHDLTGKRVAVIGSAASTVQFAPQIAERVSRLDIYQRTPNWVRPRVDSYTAEQLERFRADPKNAADERQTVWEWINRIITLDDPEVLAESTRVCLENLALVVDPEIRRKLTPDYPFGAKRPLISNDWYPIFNRPNVHLITEPIEEVTETAVVTRDGVRRVVDTIILATGFHTGKFLAAIPIVGRGGQRLDEAWADGAEAYLGITVAGFPNLFMLYGPNTNNGSILYQIECQVDYAVRHIARLERERLAWIDVRPEVMTAYNDALQADLNRVAVWAGLANDYYRTESGRIVTQWPHSMDRYRDMTRAPDDDAYETAPA